MFVALENCRTGAGTGAVESPELPDRDLVISSFNDATSSSDFDILTSTSESEIEKKLHYYTHMH